MKTVIMLSILLSLFSRKASAQSESPAQKEAAGKWERFYNNQQYDSIFALFSANMQKALPLPKAAGFFGGLHHDAGQITARVYEGHRWRRFLQNRFRERCF
ncbi:MAG: peptidase [Flaviaesturariibacter sp.]|nr:peptidase [Flaviaesturariibacter sp.]